MADDASQVLGEIASAYRGRRSKNHRCVSNPITSQKVGPLVLVPVFCRVMDATGTFLETTACLRSRTRR